MAYTAIDDPSAHFHIQLYTGNDGSNRAITNDANAGDFRPDLIWIKNRDATSAQSVFDSTRLSSGEATLILRTNSNAAEQDNKCVECRLCWDKSIKNITYKYH